MDVHHRGGWIQIFGSKAYEFQTAKVTLMVILKVTGNGSTYDFLLVFNCNYDSIVYHFRDIITFSQNLKRSHDLNTSFSEIIYHTFTSTP